MSKDTILIVDDEEHIVELLDFNLSNTGFNTLKSYDGLNALETTRKVKPDLVLLDIMLPGMDGIEVCRRLKGDESTKLIPIIMLTAKSEEIDKILGLEIGADDYITKPFSIRELIARVKAVLRRANLTDDNGVEATRLVAKDLVIDIDKYEVFKSDQKIDLTLKEFELLKLLVQNKGRVLTRDFLLDRVWGYEYYGETRTVDVHIRHLRSKLENDGMKYIETVRGVGYKFSSKGE